MGKLIRRVVAILLTVTAIIIAVLPSGSAQATTTHGDFEYDGNTLVKYLGDAPEITVPNWVTKIGKDCFSKNTSLQKIVLPDSVKTIDYNAFEGCTNLQIVEIPESVRTIGSSAFSGCSNLYSITLPEKLESLGSGVFAGCISLANVPIDINNIYYNSMDGAIYSKDGSLLVQYLPGRPYTSYDMPLSVNEIGEYAFWGASNLNNVTISPGVGLIPEYAFAYCNGLTNVALPSSVERINAYSFADCDNLQYINIPDSVGFIHEKAFYMTNGTVLRFVDEFGNTVKTLNSDDINDSDVEGDNILDSTNGNNVAAITASSSGIAASDDSESEATDESEYETELDDDSYNGSFSGESSWITEIDNIDFSENKSQGEIGSSMIVGGNALVMVPSNTRAKGYNMSDAEAEDDYVSSTNLSEDSKSIIIEDTLASYNSDSPDVNITDNISKLGSRVFYKNNEIKNVILPEGLEQVGDFAFARSSVESVYIPEGTTKIGYGAFYNCSNLSSLNVPSTVDTVELGAFDGSLWLDNWRNNESSGDYCAIGDGVLIAYKGNDSNIIIPDGIKHIGPGVFKNNKLITSVIIPDSVIDIGEDAFNGCNKLEYLTLGNNVNTIYDRAFKDTSISTLSIPDSVSGIGLGAFDMTNHLGSLNCVLFLGNDLPNVIYNDTATRMSANSLRTPVFNGVANAIVEADCDLSSGTILDPRYYGFHGAVYTVDKNGEEDNSNTLTLVKATTLPNQYGDVTIDSHVQIGNDGYVIGNVTDTAFDDYKLWPFWSDFKPENIIVDGNASEDVDTLIAKVKEEINTVELNIPEGINVTIMGNSFPQESHGVATLPEDNNTYYLSIAEDTTYKDIINKAYFADNGTNINGQAIYLSMDLYEDTQTIPIHKLGQHKMEVAIPVPTSLVGKEGIQVACLNDNNTLTDLSTDVAVVEDVPMIHFVANHFSPYVIYCRTITASNIDNNQGNTINTSDLSGTENVDMQNDIEYSFSITESANARGGLGNYIAENLHKEVADTIEVKWFVVIILISFAGILALYKPNNKKKNKV